MHDIAWDHVERQFPKAFLANSCRVQFVAKRRCRNDDNGLAQLAVRDPNSCDFGNEPSSKDNLLDFCWAHSVARSLDHIVISTDEVNEPILVLPHQIARPDRDLGKGKSSCSTRRGAKPFCGQFRRIPVPHADKRPTMNQLTGLAGWAFLAVRPNHENLRVRNRFADRIRAAIDLLWRKVCRSKRLSEPVHQIGRRARENGSQPLQEWSRHVAACIREVSQPLAGVLRPSFAR